MEKAKYIVQQGLGHLTEVGQGMYAPYSKLTLSSSHIGLSALEFMERVDGAAVGIATGTYPPTLTLE